MKSDQFSKLVENLGEFAMKVADDAEKQGGKMLFVIVCSDMSSDGGGAHMFANVANKQGKLSGDIAIEFLSDFVKDYALNANDNDA